MIRRPILEAFFRVAVGWASESHYRQRGQQLNWRGGSETNPVVDQISTIPGLQYGYLSPKVSQDTGDERHR